MPLLASETVPAGDKLPAPKPVHGLREWCADAAQGAFSYGVLVLALLAGLGAGLFEASRRWFRPAVATAMLFALVWLVYRPVLPGNFIWDDQLVLKQLNPLINGELGPRTIWFQTDFVLANFGFWAEWLAWHDHPQGYHWVNLCLHGLSALLVWRVLVKLKIPGAWLAAALFAVHPVCVNSVARIAELKNTLSLPFFLVSFWAWLRDEEESANRRWPSCWYFISLAAFVVALLVKTTILILPVLLLLCAHWQRGRLVRADGSRTAPFFLVALAFGLMSTWFQKHQALAGETLAPTTFAQRLAVAGHDVWFYAGKALCPVNLAAVYPWWHPETAGWMAWLPLALLGALGLACWQRRHAWGRHGLFALGCFTVALFPALGFFDAQFLTWFQVSDHMEYVALIAPLALVAAWLATRISRGFMPVAAALVLALAMLGSERARVFASDESLWRDTLVKNPAAWPARNNLGVILAGQKQLPAAVEQFQQSLAANPGNPAAEIDLGQVMLLQGELDEAQADFEAALRGKPLSAPAHEGLAGVFARRGDTHRAITHLKAAVQIDPKVATRVQLAGLLFQSGDSAGAVYQYRNALAVEPDLPEVLSNLAWLLATCADARVRDGAEAVRRGERACALTNYKQANMTGTLAAAYAEAGRFPEAVKTCRQTIELANAAGNSQFAALNGQLLNLYEHGRPYHSPATSY